MKPKTEPSSSLPTGLGGRQRRTAATALRRHGLRSATPLKLGDRPSRISSPVLPGRAKRPPRKENRKTQPPPKPAKTPGKPQGFWWAITLADSVPAKKLPESAKRIQAVNRFLNWPRAGANGRTRNPRRHPSFPGPSGRPCRSARAGRLRFRIACPNRFRPLS